MGNTDNDSDGIYAGDTAGICPDKEEFKAFMSPGDVRQKWMFFVKKELLKPYMS